MNETQLAYKPPATNAHIAHFREFKRTIQELTQNKKCIVVLTICSSTRGEER